MKSTINKILFFAAVAAATLPAFTSCSQDESIDERLSSGAIGFAPLLNHHNTGTRSTGDASIITGETANKFDGFYVWGYTMDDAASSAKNAIYLKRSDTTAGGVPIGKSTSSGGTGWGSKSGGNYYYGYLNGEDLKYWPKDKLEFIAIGPLSKADDATNGSDISNLSFSGITASRPTNNKYTFTYTAEAGDADLSKHTDIVYATARQQGTVGSATVNLAFKHALSKVKFQGYVGPNQPGLTVIIKDITICHVDTKGTATIEVTDDAANSLSWAAETDGNYILTTGAGPVTLSANATVTSEVTTSDLSKEILLIPQTHDVWQSGAISTADTETKTYLKINCVIYQVDGVPIVGTKVDSGGAVTSEGGVQYNYGEVYAHMVENPGTTTSLTWVAGTSYTYTLNFGVGKNANGDVISAPITFSVSSVEGWTESAQSVSL